LDFTGTESYNLDFPNGGIVLAEDFYARQGPLTDNNVMFNYGGETDPPRYPGGSLLIRHGIFESTTPKSTEAGSGYITAIRNLLPDITAQVEDCEFLGTITIPVKGPHTMRRCRLNGVALPDVG
jgi:hypothetical protein